MRGGRIDRLMVHGGTAIIFAVMVALAHRTPDGIEGSAFWIILGGVALAIHTAGIFNTVGKTFSARKYLRLRAELDDFIAMVRHLNRHAIEKDGASIERVNAAMHRSVDKMAEVAGVED